MANERVQRRLAAILAADVAGYSRMMGEDEEGTLTALTAHRTQLVEPVVAAHGGRIFKTMGDGFLAEFASVLDAVRGAIAIQQGMHQRNAEAPTNRRIDFRIGVNLGDVIVQDGDVYGDGVNVASRLEGLADPGGICVSEVVYQQARNRLDLAFEDLGPTPVKNMAEPIRPFRAILGESAHAARERRTAARFPDQPSIAVLPFANMSSEAEQEYFSDGITEDLITDLSKVSGLFVIARNSTLEYKRRPLSVAEVGRELRVRYVLEGSVRKAGSRVRVTAQLVDAVTGGHIWAERYDRDLVDIFAVQDEVTRQIVAALALRLKPGERERIFERGTGNFDAYDLFLRGRELVWAHAKAENRIGEDLLRRAIQRDPGFARAYATLAFARVQQFINRWVADPEAALDDARTLAERALAMAPQEPDCRGTMSLVLRWQRDLDRALAEAQAELALEPSSASGHVNLGVILIYAGRSGEALEAFQTAMRLDPLYPDLYLYFLALAHFHLGHYAEAERLLHQRIARNPNTDITHVLLASVYGHCGRLDEARAAWHEALRINPDYSFAHRRKILPFKDPADLERMAEGLRKADLPT